MLELQMAVRYRHGGYGLTGALRTMLSGYNYRGGAEGGFGPTTGAGVPPDDPG